MFTKLFLLNISPRILSYFLYLIDKKIEMKHVVFI